MANRIITKVKPAINKSGEKICVPAKYISIDQAEALGVDLSKIKSFQRLCKEAGFNKIIVGSTTKEINLNGGQIMPKRRYPKVERLRDLSDLSDLSDVGFMDKLKSLVPTKADGISMGEGLASMIGSLILSNYTVNKITQDWIRIALKAILAVGGGKAANNYINEQVGIGVFAAFGLDFAMELAAKFGISLPISFATPAVTTETATSGLGQLKFNKPTPLLFGSVKASTPRRFQGLGEIKVVKPTNFSSVAANVAQPFMGIGTYQPYTF